MPNQSAWRGTEEEMTRLLTALDHNCSCEFNDQGARCKPCSLHSNPLTQAEMDKLLFVSRIVRRLEHEEGLDAL